MVQQSRKTEAGGIVCSLENFLLGTRDVLAPAGMSVPRAVLAICNVSENKIIAVSTTRNQC